MNENRQEELLQLRAGLGIWKVKDGHTIIITTRNVTSQMDLRQYGVSEERGSYKMPFKYNITAQELTAKIKTLKQTGYKLITPQFPELQKFFRNGMPITNADLLEDAINEIKISNNTQSGIDFLLDSWK